ncbi:hypothetical protein WMY93_012527 [Mugilogobius chulae]|uniref:TATA element modulatory factor 1 TATA binding domain-containing protein n=1 Tax=Mugilogobius chulae TaxID=88201 RepID=A0AAW0P8W8_9GOBI
MSWFNASHLSSFAKQALTTAQKSIDRVLDIKEEDQWGDTTVMPYNEVVIKWRLGIDPVGSSPEEKTPVTPPSSEAITTPVTRTVVDESENFFSAFLSPGDVPSLPTSPVVSVPPTKSQTRLQEKDKKNTEIENVVKNLQISETVDTAEESLELSESQADQPTEPTPPGEFTDTTPLQPVSLSDNVETKTSEEEVDSDLHEVANSEKPNAQDIENSEEPSKPTASESTDSAQSDPSPPLKEAEQKDQKTEDRQSDTPSPPVSAFSSGTSTTSDIEVLDHESVLSESSASSRQETVEGKAGLHLMQGSFQLLTASTCGDFPRLEDYTKLTESCGSSSDAFERIDSFSVQSLDSRSVSEVNSDDEIPGSRTLASVTAASLTVPETTICQKEEDEVTEKEAQGENVEEGFGETLKEQVVDEMEESGRSATPVNCEQPEDLLDHETEEQYSQETPKVIIPPITVEMKSASTFEILELQKVIHELTGRLEKRESQLLVVSKDKARLEEECDNLRDEVIGLKEESSTVQSLKDEFTQRIADAERKAQLACKERDIAKKEIKGLREELSTRLNSANTMEIIKEKEEQIRGLLEEGEKLSKQQLQHSNIIKKLRAKEKESDSRIIKHEKKVKELEEELKILQQVLDGKEEVEKQHRENIKTLNAAVERHKKETSRLQSDSDELQEKNRSLQSALDNAYKELAELHKTNASRASEAEEAALSREIQAKEQLSVTLEKAQEEARVQQEALANQVADLRLALQRAEQQQARKEDYLRDEISELQQRLQEAETRNQELSQSVTSATRPLLRQIENLQASLGGQTASWEKLEKNISDRLADAQAQLAVAEKARVLAQLDAEKNKKEKLEDESSRHLVELENLRGEHSRILEETKKEKLLLTNQLEMEKMKVEQEKKKCYLAQEALREKERREPQASSTPSLSRSSSISGMDNAGLQTSVLSQDDSLDHSPWKHVVVGVHERDQPRRRDRTAAARNCWSGEESCSHGGRACSAHKSKRRLEEKVKEIPKLRVLLKDLEQRHNTILQMYGEKAEEAEELRLDSKM